MRTAQGSTCRVRRVGCCLCLLAAFTLVGASAADARLAERMGEVPAVTVGDPAAASGWREDPPETLWILDADFEDLTGDNVGWQSHDMSWFPGQENYWHKDTIRINGFAYLGDSTWWCGTYNPWWIQPRGYGNNWIQHLYREFPLSDWSEPGDTVYFEWDQRYAMENGYDYGYVDFSRDYGASWITLGVFANNGFAGKPGMSRDWDSPVHGHVMRELPPDFAGSNMLVRFRFESDGAYSAQDEYDNGPPCHSVQDGAWQLDNFTLWVNDDVVWYDDCESPGDNGWIHHDLAASDQTGVAFERTYAPETHRGPECGDDFSWTMAAVDPMTGRMADEQNSLLISPPLYVGDAERIVARWNVWYDLPVGSDDVLRWSAAQSDTSAGLSEEAHFGSGGWYYWPGLSRRYDRPGWATLEGEWSLSEGKDWTAVSFGLTNREPMAPDEDPSRLEDVFGDGSGDHYGFVAIEDLDGIASARTVASDDDGQTWHSRAMTPSGDIWRAWVPTEVVHPASEIHYYFEATDGLGNVSTLPAGAPDELLEFSILPIHGGLEDPGILIVDKRRLGVPGSDRRYTFASDEYIMEALDILGYEYDVYDAPDTFAQDPYPIFGPYEPEAYAYYDTHIWILGNAIRNTLHEDDQGNLIQWLADSSHTEPRSLLLCGNEIGYDLVEQGYDVTGFFADWLGAVYVDRHPGPFYVDDPDTTIRVRDAGLGFMTYDDGECWLRTACPEMQLVDEVDAIPGVSERALEYVNGLGETRAAGVAKTDSVLGYRIVYLPFDIALMNEGLNGVNGHYRNAVDDRVDLLANIMGYFGKAPGGPGTGVSDTQAHMNRLARAYPNPFNPTTMIEYSVAASCRVTLRVYDLAGRVVRTLVDEPVEAGEYAVVWEGTTDSGKRAGSGVYFLKMETEQGFCGTRKLVLLK